ncbi:MAG: NAD(P)H-dependent oxidoreductase [Proteobacteria bacterium]|nr:NAD(P)H-dependent oxidoreductase [Pseudomonadota bacterium]
MRILVLQAHPRASFSIAQKALTAAARQVAGVTFRDLYALYPDFNIDIGREQKLLLEHDLIVLQHPFYWYSSPAIIKEWQDLVLDFGWAYGPGGDNLHGKNLMSVLTTGGPETAYHERGRNRFAINDLLAPFNQSAHRCGMAYLKPFVVFESRLIGKDALAAQAEDYRALLEGFASGKRDPRKHLIHGYKLPDGYRQKQST